MSTVDIIVCLDDDSPVKNSKVDVSSYDSGVDDLDESVVEDLDFSVIDVNDDSVVDVSDNEDNIVDDDEVLDKTIEVDDLSFEALEVLIDEEKENPKNDTENAPEHRIKKCFVKLYNCPVYYENVDCDDTLESSYSVTQLGYKEGEEEKFQKSVTNKSPENNNDLSTNTRKTKRNKETNSDEDDISDYEKIRENNIKERMEMLKSLGISSDMSAFKADSGLTPKTRDKRKSEDVVTERRKSARLAAREEDDDYLPDYRDEKSEEKYALDDPEDHSHDGIRKHPCKECPNCIKPDCRRCIFCRDKRKYGGKNIKKQKCMYKDKCSNPIVLCNICNGTRVSTYSCNICGEKFDESYKVDQHKENFHQIAQVRRRSSRLSEQKSQVVYEEDSDCDN